MSACNVFIERNRSRLGPYFDAVTAVDDVEEHMKLLRLMDQSKGRAMPITTPCGKSASAKWQAA